jgi:hypothetical protein
VLTLYLYDNARPHIHDSIPAYVNCVPLSKQGIAKHFTLTQNPDEADYFYQGQLDDSVAHDAHYFRDKFSFFERYKEKHICDIEGDWPNLSVPKWLDGSIITINGFAKQDLGRFAKAFVRPTFSSLLVWLGKNGVKPPAPAEQHGFGFKGLMDPHGLRHKMATAFQLCQEIPFDIAFNTHWNGPTPIDSPVVQFYAERLRKYSLGLCPRGNGKDSVRFFETCAYGRVPVVIGSNILFGEGYANLDFVEYVDENLPIGKMARKFADIWERNPPDVAFEKGVAAYNYFNNYVVDYFKDPTAYFIKQCLRSKP